MRIYHTPKGGKDRQSASFYTGPKRHQPIEIEPIAALRDTFLRRIDAHEVSIGIIGQGYVGLPLALTFGERP